MRVCGGPVGGCRGPRQPSRVSPADALLVFTARCYGDFSSWHWCRGGGPPQPRCHFQPSTATRCGPSPFATPPLLPVSARPLLCGLRHRPPARQGPSVVVVLEFRCSSSVVVRAGERGTACRLGRTLPLLGFRNRIRKSVFLKVQRSYQNLKMEPVSLETASRSAAVAVLAPFPGALTPFHLTTSCLPSCLCVCPTRTRGVSVRSVVCLPVGTRRAVKGASGQKPRRRRAPRIAPSVTPVLVSTRQTLRDHLLCKSRGAWLVGPVGGGQTDSSRDHAPQSS